MFIRGSRSKDEHQQIKAKRRHPVIPRTGPASRMRNPIGLYKNVNKYGEEEEEGEKGDRSFARASQQLLVCQKANALQANQRTNQPTDGYKLNKDDRAHEVQKTSTAQTIFSEIKI